MQLPDSGMKRTASRQPHEQLDALGARGPDELRIRIACQCSRVTHQAVHAHEIEIAVDESGARALELMRQSTGTDHQHLGIFAPALDRPTNRLSELEASGRRR